MMEKDSRIKRSEYSDRSPFVRLLEKPAHVRIYDVFLRKHYTELSAAEVADLGGIDKATFHKNKKELLNLGIIEQTRVKGQTEYYRLNKENEFVEILHDTHTKLQAHAPVIAEQTEVYKPGWLLHRDIEQIRDALGNRLETERNDVSGDAASGPTESEQSERERSYDRAAQKAVLPR
ncbi:putative transcriptional regulator, MarR family [Halalkaliarchaeum sp. AArc-CO]|uniref:winged helix-turn-helix domain-containing protein n=1 Tax=Halalkaliarchaeum sp. AArc-CO TaxID=2866381 RepID=UPI00217ED9E3|nr:winged helix-turn-helix domain-containing protein [Halalkaliarchaeum sp. AArc-CO]UWG50059.1 putative transcriptional regulator, MarR family [Halalkaliarchaeum sp. AArc-CO]